MYPVNLHFRYICIVLSVAKYEYSQHCWCEKYYTIKVIWRDLVNKMYTILRIRPISSLILLRCFFCYEEYFQSRCYSFFEVSMIWNTRKPITECLVKNDAIETMTNTTLKTICRYQSFNLQEQKENKPCYCK